MKSGIVRIFNLAAVLVWTFSFPPAAAAELTLKVVAKAPPAKISDEIAAILQKQCIQLLDGEKPVFEFWFRSVLPLEEKPASASKSLAAVKAATLMGVVEIHNELRDYRDDALHEGMHTMRFGLIPEDGDHQGASLYPYFSVLTPAAKDKTIDGIDNWNDLVDASLEETAAEHPMILSLRPGSADDGAKLPRLQEPAAEHKSVQLKISAEVAGGETLEIVFEVVYEGIGEF